MILTMSKKAPIKKRIYLDFAAGTPLEAKVAKAMLPYLLENYGNPSAIHQEGRVARLAVETARQKVATLLGVRPNGVIFTGSGTESNNLAIVGYLESLRANGRKYSEMELVTTKIEHPSILALLPKLKNLGVKIKFVAVDSVGLINHSALQEILSTKTALVTFAYANSEIGTIQPVSRLVRVVRNFCRENNLNIKVHLDAAQAPLWLNCSFSPLGVDSIALDAGKCGGPKGVGILAGRQLNDLKPIMAGGGQEAGLRPGTENVVGIVGSAEAITLAQMGYEKRASKVCQLQAEALKLIGKHLPEAIINGPVGTDRLANNVNFSLPGFDSEYAVVFLDTHGVSASTKSACAGAGSGVSHVVLTISDDQKRASSTLRLSLGEKTTKKDIAYTFKVLEEYCAKMRTLTQ
jgi:cysteine desulfurase